MKYKGFPSALVATLVCQNCRSSLEVSSPGTHIVDGEIFCKACNATYRVSGGVLNFLARTTLDEVLQSEVVTRDEYASGYDKKLSARYEKEVVSTLREIGSVAGKSIIEYGAGTGRLTTLLAPHSERYLACDFSLASLRLLAEKEVPSSVGLVCADATQLVTANGAFDLALATQFYEHIPTREQRENFLLHAKETLLAGGTFVSTTYHHDLRRRLSGKPQEGMHSEKIFFHYYTINEIKKELGKYFVLKRIFPIDITLPFEAKFRLNEKLGGSISRICEYIPFLNLFGHLVLVVAKKHENI